MASPEGIFSVDVDLDNPMTRKHVFMLDAAVRTLLLVHAHPEMLSMEVCGMDTERRYFTDGGYLAPKGVTPEVSLTRDKDAYYFHSSLVDPSRLTAATILNMVDAKYTELNPIDVTSVQRSFIHRPDRNGDPVRRPGPHELSASAAIASVARATDRLSREFSAVHWKVSRSS